MAPGFSTPLLVSMETRAGTQEPRIDHHKGREKHTSCYWYFTDYSPDIFTPPGMKVVIIRLHIKSRTSQSIPDVSCLSPFVSCTCALKKEVYTQIKIISDTTVSCIFSYFRAMLPFPFWQHKFLSKGWLVLLQIKSHFSLS